MFTVVINLTDLQVIEFFATLFTPSAWACFHEFINPYYNTKGHQYDHYLYHYCTTRATRLNEAEFKMALIQNMTAHHVPWKINRVHNKKMSMKSIDMTYHDRYFFSIIHKSAACIALTKECSEIVLKALRVGNNFF